MIIAQEHEDTAVQGRASPDACEGALPGEVPASGGAAPQSPAAANVLAAPPPSYPPTRFELMDMDDDSEEQAVFEVEGEPYIFGQSARPGGSQQLPPGAATWARTVEPAEASNGGSATSEEEPSEASGASSIDSDEGFLALCMSVWRDIFGYDTHIGRKTLHAQVRRIAIRVKLCSVFALHSCGNSSHHKVRSGRLRATWLAVEFGRSTSAQK